MTISGFILSAIAGVVGGIVLSFLTLIFFDREKLLQRINRISPFPIYKTFDRVSSRSQVQRLFSDIFLTFQPKGRGRILLMSNSGGYPEFDPFPRILEIATNENYDLYVAVNSVAFKDWASHNTNTCLALLIKENIKVYVFDNLTPYNFRIGINTKLQLGFFCAYYGHDDADRVSLEGISTKNPLLLRAIEALYIGLLPNGVRVAREDLEIWDI